MSKVKFRVLYTVFLFRIFDVESLTADSDSTKLLGQIAALLAGISILFTGPLMLVGGRLPQASLWVMAHFLIATTMVVVGLFSLLSWDSIALDRRDVLVLAPLPVPTTILFASKLAAVAASLGMVIVSLNILTGLVWPLLFSPGYGILECLRSFAAYWVTISLAASFMFCLVLGIQGVAAQFLSRQLYLRTSALLQVIGFVLFVGLYILEPSLESSEAIAAPSNRAYLQWAPSYWFFGLFEKLNGANSSGFAWLAGLACNGLVIIIFVAGGVLLLSYFRTLPKVIEEPDLLPPSRHMPWWPRCKGSVSDAIIAFSVRTITRSSQHRLIVSFYLGVGWAIVMAYMRIAFGHVGFVGGLKAEHMRTVVLTASLLLTCVTIAAIRLSFSLPISLRANWIFRTTEHLTVINYISSVRKTLLFLGVAPVWLVIAIVILVVWPLKFAVGHLLGLGVFAVCLVEASLLPFQRLPFTCSHRPGKASIHIVFWTTVILILPVANLIAHLEERLLHTLVGWFVLMISLGSILIVLRWRTAARANSTTQLLFTEALETDLLMLNLFSDESRSQVIANR